MNYLNISNLKLWMTSSVINVTDSHFVTPSTDPDQHREFHLRDEHGSSLKNMCKLVGGFIGLLNFYQMR